MVATVHIYNINKKQKKKSNFPTLASYQHFPHLQATIRLQQYCTQEHKLHRDVYCSHSHERIVTNQRFGNVALE